MEYQYNMPELHQVEFERMRGFVEDAYRDSLRGNVHPEPMSLILATQDLSETRERRSAKTEGKYVGFAWTSGTIWVKPGRPTFDMKRTTIHELAHVRVSGEAHGPKFRRVFGVALALYMNSVGKDWVDIRREIHAMVYRYRHYRVVTPQGRFNSYSEYMSKCTTEIDNIVKAAKRVCNIWL